MGNTKVQSTYRSRQIANLEQHIRYIDNQLDSALRKKSKIDEKIRELKNQKRETIERISKLKVDDTYNISPIKNLERIQKIKKNKVDYNEN